MEFLKILIVCFQIFILNSLYDLRRRRVLARVQAPVHWDRQGASQTGEATAQQVQALQKKRETIVKFIKNSARPTETKEIIRVYFCM